MKWNSGLKSKVRIFITDHLQDSTRIGIMVYLSPEMLRIEMQPHPILTLKRFLAPGLSGGIVGFIIFLMLTYPEAMSADLPLPPTLAFGSGPRVKLQSMFLNLRTDLYWLTIFLNHGFGFIGLFALAFTGIAALIERIETSVSTQTGTAFSIPKIPVRYLLSALTGLGLGLLLDFA